MVKQIVGIKRHVQLFLQPETYFPHLHPIIPDIRIRSDIYILTQAYPYLVNLGRAHCILQPLINRKPVHQCEPNFFQIIICKSPSQIGQQIYCRIQGQPDLSHRLIIIGRIGIRSGVQLILKTHPDLLHLQPVKLRIRINGYIQSFFFSEFNLVLLRFLIFVNFHHGKTQFLLFPAIQVNHIRYQSLLIYSSN